jgi:hypothetical protein
MTERLARFSITYDGDQDGDRDLVINAGSGRGFTVTGILMKWVPEDMSSHTDVPYVSNARFVGLASGGTAANLFSHTDGDVAEASGLIDPTSLGTGQQPGPQYYPGTASYTGTEWYLHGDQYFADLSGSGYEIYVAAGNSLRVRAGKMVSTTVFFYEDRIS